MCEDYPCCGHEMNDCDGSLYGSDEAIMAAERRAIMMEDDPYYYDGEW